MKKIDINNPTYAEFYSMVDLVAAMRKTITVMSWGAEQWKRENELFLSFVVNGRKFQGKIYIGVNGLDLFDIYLCDLSGVIQEEILNVYIDELLGVIDKKIESD